MKRSTFILIAACVVVAHLVGFYCISGWHPLPREPYIPPPNFSLGWAKFTDPATHQKMVYQEFTVSTHVDKTAPEEGRTAP